jgi:hypothetical protein
VVLDPPERRRPRIPPIRAVSQNLRGPYGAALGIGFTNADPDPVDQVVRTIPLAADDPEDELLKPGLSLAILIQTERLRPVQATGRSRSGSRPWATPAEGQATGGAGVPGDDRPVLRGGRTAAG